MKVDYYKIGYEFKRIKKDYLKNIDNIFNKGSFILGKSNKKFEKEISKLLNVKYVCGLGNGTDALELGMMAAGVKKGDEVITATNSWISSFNSIISIGAKPILIDVNDDFNMDINQLKKAITKKTSAIMPVHLNGLTASMKDILKIAKKNKLLVIEDSAQSIMSKYNEKFTGTIGDVGCFSMHPTKNLGAAGDAGFVTTNNKNIYKKIKLISNHGMNPVGISKTVGRNSRLDEIQAEFVFQKLRFLKSDIKKRIEIAKKYTKNLNNLVRTPYTSRNESLDHTYHRYVIMLKNKKERDGLKIFLSKKGIETKIHYPIPIHKCRPFLKYGYKKNLKNSEDQSNRILSLPCNHFLKSSEVNFVIKMIKFFFKS
jgi:UDP-2-acetamido-2-deoxy-ribo-hexuluronate aminotransferase